VARPNGQPQIIGHWKFSGNRLRGHVPQQDLANNVMDQNKTSGPRRGESVLGHNFRPKSAALANGSSNFHKPIHGNVELVHPERGP